MPHMSKSGMAVKFARGQGSACRPVHGSLSRLASTADCSGLLFVHKRESLLVSDGDLQSPKPAPNSSDVIRARPVAVESCRRERSSGSP